MVKNLDVSSADTLTMDQGIGPVTKPTYTIDGVGADETKYTNPNWTKCNGYYRKNQGGTKSAIDKFAMWAVGKGYKADEKTTKILKRIRGFGKDSFDGIMENMIRVKKINGDSFAHIIRDKTVVDKVKNVLSKISLGLLRYQPGSGELANLKPLNPGRVQTVTDDMGMIKRYDYTTPDGKTVIKEILPNEMFHLVNDREADEIHGISVYEGMEDLLDKIQQLDNNMSTVFLRFVMPLLMFKMNTDDIPKVKEFKRKIKTSLEGGEPIFIHVPGSPIINS